MLTGSKPKAGREGRCQGFLGCLIYCKWAQFPAALCPTADARGEEAKETGNGYGCWFTGNVPRERSKALYATLNNPLVPRFSTPIKDCMSSSNDR